VESGKDISGYLVEKTRKKAQVSKLIDNASGTNLDRLIQELEFSNVSSQQEEEEGSTLH